MMAIAATKTACIACVNLPIDAASPKGIPSDFFACGCFGNTGCLPADTSPVMVCLPFFFAMQHKYTFLAGSLQKKGTGITVPLTFYPGITILLQISVCSLRCCCHHTK